MALEHMLSTAGRKSRSSALASSGVCWPLKLGNDAAGYPTLEQSGMDATGWQVRSRGGSTGGSCP